MPSMTRPDPIRRLSHARIAAWLAAGAVLSLPLIAMQFTHEVVWTASDFVMAGLLLFGALGMFELLTRRPASVGRRVMIGGLLLGAVLIIWIDGAVGIVDDRSASTDAMVLVGAALAIVAAIIVSRRTLRS